MISNVEQSERIVSSGTIATMEEFRKRPDDFEVAITFLGFTLTEIGSDFSTLLTIHEGSEAMVVMYDRLIAERESRLAELEQRGAS